MKIFNHFLTEAQVPRLIDIEDLTWKEGTAGVQQAYHSLLVIFNYLKGKKIETPIIQKLDAKPSLIMGEFTYSPILYEINGSPVNPSDDGYLMIDDEGHLIFNEETGEIIRSGSINKIPFKTIKIKTEHHYIQNSFFIATRSLFAKKPKIILTKKDIVSQYQDNPGLQEKLMYALQYGRKLKISGIIQGDLLFTEKDLTKTKIQDEDNIVFRTNTIIYSLPESHPMFKVIERAKIGLYFYASYTGEFKWVAKRNSDSGKIEYIYPSADWLSQISKVDTSRLAKTQDVFYDDSILKDSIKKHNRKKISVHTEIKLQQMFNDVKSYFQKISQELTEIFNNKLLKKMIIEYTNELKKKGSGELIHDQLTTALFLKFVQHYYDKKTHQLKLKHAIKRAEQERALLIRFTEGTSGQMLSRVFKLQLMLEKLKLELLNQLKSLKLKSDAFVQTKDDFFYQIGTAEYMVDTSDQNIMRLSDRSYYTDHYKNERDQTED